MAATSEDTQPSGTTHEAIDDEVALVVMRSELPAVTRDGDLIYAAGVGGDITLNTSWSADDVRREAFAFLAVAEHLEGA